MADQDLHIPQTSSRELQTLPAIGIAHADSGARPSSTLLQPILALSRPASPSASPSTSSGTFGPVSSIEEPADRSASSLPAQFPPRASTDPAPTVESQGFVLYLGSLVAWTVFLIWGLCPDEWLEWMGIEWYPSRSVNARCLLSIYSRVSLPQRVGPFVPSMDHHARSFRLLLLHRTQHLHHPASRFPAYSHRFVATLRIALARR